MSNQMAQETTQQFSKLLTTVQEVTKWFLPMAHTPATATEIFMCMEIILSFAAKMAPKIVLSTVTARKQNHTEDLSFMGMSV